MSVSRYEDTIQDIVDELETIQQGTTYRTSIVLPVSKVILDPTKITSSPRVFVVTGDENLSMIDSTKTMFDSEMRVLVCGLVKGSTSSNSEGLNEDLNALAHDLKKCVASFCTKYISDSTNRWQVKRSAEPKMTRSVPPDANFGWVFLEFTVQIFAQAGTF